MLWKSSPRRMQIGDELRVRLVRVEPSDRKIDFELVDKTGSHWHPRRAKREGKKGR